MSLPKQKFREIVFQILYCHDFKCSLTEDLLSLLMRENKVSKKNVVLCFEKFKAINIKLDSIDPLISEASTEYAFDRISSVEKNILRLALYEIFYDDTIPEKVGISEGVRLSKKYGTPESAKFVNAILDTLYKKRKELATQV